MSNHIEIKSLDVGTRVGLNDTGGLNWSSRFGTNNIIDGIVCRDKNGQNSVFPLNKENLSKIAKIASRRSLFTALLNLNSLQVYKVEPDQMVTAKR